MCRKANSIFGRNLWNNLLQPWSHKQVSLKHKEVSKHKDIRKHKRKRKQVS